MNVLVTGGKGSLGQLVMPRLSAHGVHVGTRTPASRDEIRFDLADPASIDGAAEDAEVIVHLATDPFHGRVEREGSARLFSAAAAAAVSHVVYVSIVGIDQHPYRYYQTKLAIERALVESGVPWTILRTTQFHSLIPRFVDELARLPVVPYPTGVRLQPIDPLVVADRVAELAELGPSGRVADMGGEEILAMEDMARDYLTSIGKKRLLVPVPFWGGAVGAFRRGDVLTDQVDRSGRTYGEYLASSQ